MTIRKKRIRNIFPYIRFITDGNKFIIGIKDLNKYSEILEKIGFSTNSVSGNTILPPSLFGPISLFNAEGKYIKHTDQPMETAYSQRVWHWEEFHGPYGKVPRSKIVDVPYKRYPRDYVSAPGVQLTFFISTSGEPVIIGPLCEKSLTNKAQIEHIVNLFLEIFGECEFFTENLESFIKVPLKTLNWKILPPGKRPWNELHNIIKPVIENAPKGNQAVIEYRLEKINSFKPEFAAVGEAGFRGYIILGFPDRKIYTLESLYYGNATYIFGEDWEELSKKTKAEILNDKLHKERIIHRGGWTNHIDKILQRK